MTKKDETKKSSSGKKAAGTSSSKAKTTTAAKTTKAKADLTKAKKELTTAKKAKDNMAQYEAIKKIKAIENKINNLKSSESSTKKATTKKTSKASAKTTAKKSTAKGPKTHLAHFVESGGGNCAWELTMLPGDEGHGGQQVTPLTKKFLSDEALDHYLLSLVDDTPRVYITDNNLEELNNKGFIKDDKLNIRGIDPELLAKGSVFYSLDTQSVEDSEKRLNEITDNIHSRAKVFQKSSPDADGVYEIIEKVPGSCGVTSFTDSFGLAKDWHKSVTALFDENNWRIKEKERIQTKNPDINDKEADKIIDAKVKTWDITRECGDEVHATFEAYFKGEPAPSTKHLTEEHKNYILKQAENLEKMLRIKHGAKCKILSEVSVISTNINEDLKKAIKDNTGEDIDSINGRLDLVVIDESNTVHIYDFKTANKDVGDWNNNTNDSVDRWSSTKKIDIINQLAIYAQIMKQNGFNVGSTAIIPIKLDLEYNDTGLMKADDKENYRATGLTKTGVKIDFGVINKKNAPGTIDTMMRQSGIIDLSNQTLVGKYYMNAAAMLPSGKDEFSKPISEVMDTFTTIFPNTKIDTSGSIIMGGTDRTVEWYLNTTQGKKFWREENGIYFFNNGRREVRCETIEDLKAAIETKIDEDATVLRNNLMNYGSNIRRAIKEKDLNLLEFDKNSPRTKRIELALQTYVLNEGWDLVSTNEQLAAGIFMFEKDGEMDIQVITNRPLAEVNEFTRGTSIIGERYSNEKADKKALEALSGNLEGIKATLYIAANQGLFKGKKIRSIGVINPQLCEVLSINTNKTWVGAYDRIRRAFPELNLPRIDSKLFMPDDWAILKKTQDLLYCVDNEQKIINFANVATVDGDKIHIAQEYVEGIKEQIRNEYKLGYQGDIGVDEKSAVWAEINKLSLVIASYEPVFESDKKNYGLSNSLETTEGEMSPSQNIVLESQILNSFMEDSREIYIKAVTPFKTALLKADHLISGAGRDLYRQFIRRDASGNIDQRFLFIDPDEFQGPEEARELLRTIIETLYFMRFPEARGNEVRINSDKDSGVYYEIPLMKAATVQRTFQRKGGVLKSIKEDWDQTKVTYENAIKEDLAEFKKHRFSHNTIYNPFTLTGFVRQDRISKILSGGSTMDYFEQNFETVVHKAAEALAKEQASKKYGPHLGALAIVTKGQEKLGGNDIKNIIANMNKRMSTDFYGENVMENAALYNAITLVTSKLSVIKLGLNAKAFVRELVSGVYNGFIRTLANVGPLKGVSASDYAKGIELILADLRGNFKGVSMLQAINASYGMANYSEFAGQNVVNWYKPGKFGKSTLFLGCASPDYQHRMSLLLAKMIADGCYEAHYMNENNELIYDMFKDKRFEVFFSGDTKNPKYMEQKSLYYTYVDDYTAAGVKLKKDEKTGLWILPRAYSSKEAQSIKTYGDILYGHYDKVNGASMNKSFIGAFILQFKVFTTGKLEQWFMRKTAKAGTGHYENVIDTTTGETIYFRFIDTGEGMPEEETITESEWKSLPSDKQNEYRIKKEWVGDPMEGIFWAYCDLVKFMFTDHEAFKKHLEDPFTRNLMAMGLCDMLILGLLGWLITFLFAEGHEDTVKNPWSAAEVRDALRKEGSWFETFSYNVLSGAIQDYNVFNMLDGMSDISAWQLSKKFAMDTGRLFSGKQNLFQFATNEIGALSEARGVANSLIEQYK